jgi:hypothetical protein
MTCGSGACAQARDLYADDRISWRDYIRGLCFTCLEAAGYTWEQKVSAFVHRGDA